jgi:signal transduction histidine kinase
VLQRLADDLMDVSRLELGKVQLESGTLDVREVLEDAVPACRTLAAQKSISLQTLLPPSPLQVTRTPPACSRWC